MTQCCAAWGFGLVSLLAAAVGSQNPGSSKEQTRRLIRSHKTATPPPLDGDLEKWRVAESVTFAGSPLRGRPRRATAYTLWDAQNLYLAFDVYSSKLQATVSERDGDKLWEDDGVEFLIDPLRHRTREFFPDDFSYHINILNVVYDDRGTASGQADPKWDGTAGHAVRILDDYHYFVEIAVPWTEIGLEPRENQTVIGIDLCVNGKDPETSAYSYYDWCNLKVFHDPSGYGDLILVGSLRR